MGKILNEHQCQITKSWIRKFEAQLAAFTVSETTKALHPKQRELEELAIRGQLETLQVEMAEYESVCR
jgi:hypothetical protein